MKDVIVLMICMLAAYSCKAQSPIIPLYNDTDYLETNNAYYKDTYGDLTKLVGTWSYTNGNEIFRIILKKKSSYLV